MAFRFQSAPGTVPERNYMANNSAQKRMGQETRFKFAKYNFPVKVILTNNIVKRLFYTCKKGLYLKNVDYV